MHKNGFTLIETLTVVIIIGISSLFLYNTIFKVQTSIVKNLNYNQMFCSKTNGYFILTSLFDDYCMYEIKTSQESFLISNKSHMIKCSYNNPTIIDNKSYEIYLNELVVDINYIYLSFLVDQEIHIVTLRGDIHEIS